jgi:hypothetical protein
LYYESVIVIPIPCFIPAKFSAGQNFEGKCFRKFLQGKTSGKNGFENFYKAKPRRKMVLKISAGQNFSGKCFRKFL